MRSLRSLNLAPFKAIVALVFTTAALGVPAHAWAQKDADERHRLEGAPLPIVARGMPFSGQGTCTLGADLIPAFRFEYLLPPDDQYYTLLEPNQCPSCPDTTKITAARITLFFQAQCEQPIEVSLVGVSGDDPGCATPDPDDVRMAAVPYVLDPQGQINQGLEFVLPLPEAFCITDSVFLCITVDAFGTGCDSELTQPHVVSSAPDCETCKSWNFYDDGEGGLFMDDLCEVLPPGTGRFVHYVDSDCTCDVTPTRPTSWGSLKIRYTQP